MLSMSRTDASPFFIVIRVDFVSIPHPEGVLGRFWAKIERKKREKKRKRKKKKKSRSYVLRPIAPKGTAARPFNQKEKKKTFCDFADKI